MRRSVAGDRAFRVHEILGEHGEVQAGHEQLNLRVVPVHGGRGLQHFRPLRLIYIQFRHRTDGNDRLGLREIVHGLVDIELFELCFLVGECLAGSFVGLVGRQPNLVTDGQFIVVQGKNIADPLSGIEVAVELIIAQTHDGSNQSQARPVFVAQRAKRRAGVELLDVENAVFDVERRIDVVHLELRLRAREFRLEGAQNGVRCGVGRKLLLLRGNSKGRGR